MRVRLIHAICHYHRQWLTADDRGFRSIDHKIHSSGDYRNPPPPEEHAGLRRWVESNMNGEPVALRPPEYPVLGLSFIIKLHKIVCDVKCLCCGRTHIHVMYDSVAIDAKEEIGRAKQFASLQLKSRPGRVFAKDCDVEEVDQQHAQRLWPYILDHKKKEGAWVWRNAVQAAPTRDDLRRAQADCFNNLKFTPGRRGLMVRGVAEISTPVFLADRSLPRDAGDQSARQTRRP